MSSLEKAQSGSSSSLQDPNAKPQRRWSLTVLRDGIKSKGHKLMGILYLYCI